ncbi:uncharacterized protein LOC125767456 [Anopheles funestus]|uniref:uncharacterized protein LOC125767456 n=1 Tax=Anopheles funestus TaxID=62324 RepID=UPI0020C7324A|nr:uncharacterized protein LOC125767456 [Anopheles funestus]
MDGARSLRSRTLSTDERAAPTTRPTLQPRVLLTRSSMPVVKETTSTGSAAQRDEEMRELRRTNEELRAMLAKLQEELSLFRVQMASAEANARRDAEVALSAAVRREEIAAAEIAALREALRLDREAHRRERDALNELILQVVGGQQQLGEPIRASVAYSPTPMPRRRMEQQQSEQQCGQQQQRERQQGAVTAMVEPSPDQEGGSWAEVVRRKPARQSASMQQQQQQQWPQLPQQRAKVWRQAVAGPSSQQPQQQQGQQAWRSQPATQRGGRRQRQRKTKPDAIEIAPAEGQTWTEVYQVVRGAPEMEKYAEAFGVGRRTTRSRLVMELKESANAAEVLQCIQEVCAKAELPASARLVTPTVDIRMDAVDPLAKESHVAKALSNLCQLTVEETSVRLRPAWDGTESVVIGYAANDTGDGMPNLAAVKGLETEVHHDRCPVYGKSYLTRHLTAPVWARSREGRIIDVLVGCFPAPGDCDCATAIQYFNAQRGEMVLSPEAVRKGIRRNSTYFVHSVGGVRDIFRANIDCTWERDSRQQRGSILSMGSAHPRSPSKSTSRNVGIQVAAPMPARVLAKVKLIEKANKPEPEVVRQLRNRTVLAAPAPGVSKSAKKRAQIRRSEEKRMGRELAAKGPIAHFGDHSIQGEGAAGVYSNIMHAALDDALIAGFMSDKANYNTKAVAGSLTSAIGVTHTVATTIATQIGLSREINDNTALYAKGWFLCLLQAQIEGNRGAFYAPGWNAAGVEFAERSWGDDAIGGLFESDVSNRRFVLLARYFSARQINCLKHIARAGVATAAPAEAGREPLGMAVNWFAVNISVYYAGQPPGAAINNFTASYPSRIFV